MSKKEELFVIKKNDIADLIAQMTIIFAGLAQDKDEKHILLAEMVSQLNLSLLKACKKMEK